MWPYLCSYATQMKPSILISIDDLLKTDPRIIIPKLLDSIPCEHCPESCQVSDQGSPTANDVDYQGDNDFDSHENLEDTIFGDVSPAKFFFPSSHKSHGIIRREASSSPSCFSPIPSDGGYEADEDFDPCDDLTDDIFGDVSPSRYFLPSPSRLEGMEDKYGLKLPACVDIHTYSSSSSESTSGSEDDEMEAEVCAPADQVSSCSSSDDESESRRQADENVNDSLKETALALRSILMDLEVIETYGRLGGDEFGDVLVEVHTKSHPSGPTLVAYKDAYGQITVPLIMGCNQHAAAILRKTVEENGIDSMNPSQLSCPSSWLTNNELDMFISSSEFENDPDFESCEEKELINLVEESYSRGHKRGRHELDNDEESMKRPLSSRHKIQRID